MLAAKRNPIQATMPSRLLCSPFPLLLFCLSFSSLLAASGPEASALLHWKSTLQTPPRSLSSWNNTTSPCSWAGIICHKASRGTSRVVAITLPAAGLAGNLTTVDFSSFPSLTHLNLSLNQLRGPIPPSLGGLRRLASLDLSSNLFSGPIPLSLAGLSQLSQLDVSSNHLTGGIHPRLVTNWTKLTKLSLHRNNFTGSIPQNLGNLTGLTLLYLYRNQLSGTIPQELGALTDLVNLEVSHNLLTGPIPSSLGNLSKLGVLFLHYNQLSGSIPSELGYLRSLTQLRVLGNLLTGFVPPALGNLTELTELVLSSNQISGSIPEVLGSLANMVFLEVDGNSLTGSIPSSLGNLSQLGWLFLYDNQLSGSLPPSLGSLKRLNELRVFSNRLSGPLPKELINLTNLISLELGNNDFSGSLPRDVCRGGALQWLLVQHNNFEGPIPRSLRNCTSLYAATLARNLLQGDVSHDFGVYPNLNFIDLSYNLLYGKLSPDWAKCQNLTTLRISGNMLSGPIPPELGKAPQLRVLDLSSNQLEGDIPRELSGLTFLFNLTLSNNRLSGSIPAEIGELHNLEILDLSENRLGGPIPVQLGDCSKLRSLKLSANDLNGSIPFEIGNLVDLQLLLDFSHNSLSGTIPQQLGKLEMLENMNLSHNRLSGPIPSSFGNILTFSSLDLSYNSLEGPVPKSKFLQNASLEWFLNNKGLCGEVPGLPACNSSTPERHRMNEHKVLLSVILPVGVVLVLVVMFAGFVVMHRRSAKPREEEHEMALTHVFDIWNFDGNVAYNTIIEAIENFDEKYCIGRGGYGSVYKAELPTGEVVAVKRLHSSEEGEIVDERSFRNEIEVLAGIRHRNIVKLYGFCSHARCKLLIYEYIERGSIAKILRNNEVVQQFDWNKRVQVMKDVAHALSYMHHDCSPPILHRDISSSNILLDSEFKAYISDFGIARIVKPDLSHWSTVAGTYGYIAPELSYTTRITEKCDVYSFGVLVLELIIGEHPSELISCLSSQEIRNTLINDILDQRIPPPVLTVAREVIFLVEVAFACIRGNPQARPSMKEISQQVMTAKYPTLDEPFHAIKLYQLMDL